MRMDGWVGGWMDGEAPTDPSSNTAVLIFLAQENRQSHPQRDKELCPIQEGGIIRMA